MTRRPCWKCPSNTRLRQAIEQRGKNRCNLPECRLVSDEKQRERGRELPNIIKVVNVKVERQYALMSSGNN